MYPTFNYYAFANDEECKRFIESMKREYTSGTVFNEFKVLTKEEVQKLIENSVLAPEALDLYK